METGAEGFLVTRERCNQESAKDDWGRSRWHWVSAATELQRLWDGAGSVGDKGLCLLSSLTATQEKAPAVIARCLLGWDFAVVA